MKLAWQKMAIISAFAGCILCALPAAIACTKNNHVRPADLAADAINKIFEEKKYKELDELYSKYLKEKTATPDKISALSVFHKGISQSFNVCAQPQGTDEAWLAHRASLVSWGQSSPKSPAAKLALALFSIDYGWHGRGGGYASTVSEASRALYESRMSFAERQMNELAQASKNNPAWYSGMLYLGLARKWTSKKIDALYEEAARLDPYYIDIHYDIAEYYSGSWYGSEAREHEVIDRSVELTKQRLGQSLYARLHAIQSKSPDMFKTGGVSWERMSTGLSDVLRIFPENRARNTYALYACIAKDSKILKQQLTLLGDQMDPQVWGSQNQFEYCKALSKNSESGKKLTSS